MTYRKRPHLYWPPGLDNHQFHHSLWPQLQAPFLSLLCSHLASLLFSDTQCTVLPWDSTHPSPGMFVSHLHLDFLLSRLWGLRTNFTLLMRFVSPTPMIFNLLSSYVFSKPLTPSDMPYILLVHLFTVCLTPLECKHQKSRSFCPFCIYFIPGCLRNTRNEVGIHWMLIEWKMIRWTHGWN